MIDKDKYLLYKICRLKEKASEAVLLSENKKQKVPQYNLLFYYLLRENCGRQQKRKAKTNQNQNSKHRKGVEKAK